MKLKFKPERMSVKKVSTFSTTEGAQVRSQEMVIGCTQKNSAQGPESQENNGCCNKWHLGPVIQGLQRKLTPQFKKISLYPQDKTRFQIKRRQRIPTSG